MTTAVAPFAMPSNEERNRIGQTARTASIHENGISRQQSPRPTTAGDLVLRDSQTVAVSASRRSAAPSEARPQISRARSDFGPRRQEQAAEAEEEARDVGEGGWRIRHGWETQFTSDEYLNLLNSVAYSSTFGTA